MSKHNWFAMKKTARGAADIDIFGEIGEFGIMADQFIANLRALGNVSELHIHINSPGGYVTEGYAMYNFLARHPAKKITYNDGLAASMASLLFLAGDVRIMPRNSLLMIHNPWGGINGDAEELRKEAALLEKMQNQIARAYADATLLTIDEISALMDAETWFTAEEAVEAGFADQVEEPIRLAALFNLDRFKRGAVMAKVQKQNSSVAEIDGDDESGISPEAAKKIGDAAVKAAKDREDGIRKLCKIGGVSDEQTKKFIDDESIKDAADVLAKLDDKRGKTDAEVSAHNGRPKITTDGSGKAKIDTAAIYARFNRRTAGVSVKADVKD